MIPIPRKPGYAALSRGDFTQHTCLGVSICVPECTLNDRAVRVQSSCAVGYAAAHDAHRKIFSNRTTTSKTDTMMSASSLLLTIQLVDDFLGAGFTCVFNRRLGGALILYRSSQRDYSIPDRNPDPLAIDKGA